MIKNSPLNLNEWLGVRPEQPQMLVYALAVPEATGVAYAQLASHKIGFLGVSEDDVALEGIKLCDVLEKDSNWAQLKQQWRQVLESLLIEFDSGNAAVDPRNSATCQYCHLQSMCRIKAENYE